jgi:putative copper resistance protein D
MEGFLVAARFFHFFAVIVLAGVFAFERFVADPTFRQSGAALAAAGRLHRRLGWLAWASLALALGSGAAWLVAVAAGMSGKPLGAALSQGAVPIALTRTRFGEDWLLRFGLAVLLGFCLLGRGRRQWRISGTIGWTALFLAAAMLASLAWSGHGAATPGPSGELHLAADVLHLVGAGLWLGTLPALIFFLTEARRNSDTDWAAVAAIAIRRYSTLAIASVTVLLIGGLVNTWFLAGTVPALVGTGYGRLLLAKVGLFVAMLIVAAVNLLRLAPRLAAGGTVNALWRTAARLRANARVETVLGLGVVAIVSVLGTLPPGLHSEPGWPFPFRLDASVLPRESQILLAALALIISFCAIVAVAAAAAGRYRQACAFAVALSMCLALGWVPLRSAIEPAYPTSFYIPAEPYAAASIVRGAALYGDNCARCHGATGRGDGSAAAGLPVRPANVTEQQFLARNPGDLFWLISRGMDEGVMPGFADLLSPNQRWDVINFIRARAAAALAMRVGPQGATGAALEVPDFAFEADGARQTLRRTLEKGPVLLILQTPPAFLARLQQLAAAQSQFGTVGLHVIGVELSPIPELAPEERPPSMVGVSSEVISALALFRGTDDGGETELMLDRAGGIRARWMRNMPGGLASPDLLVVHAAHIIGPALATPSHAVQMH